VHEHKSIYSHIHIYVFSYITKHMTVIIYLLTFDVLFL